MPTSMRSHERAPSYTDKRCAPMVATPRRFYSSAVTHLILKATMNARLITSIALACIAASTLGACSSMSTRDKNTAAGAAIGGVAGAVLTGGSTAGTVGGAVVGGVIGNKVDPDKK
jgi:osmotically inducible lipoprotein OsmB